MSITVETEWQSGIDDNGYGIIFGETEGANYRFCISANGYYQVYKALFDGRFETLISWTHSSSINKRGQNQLRIETEGSLCRFYVNERLLDQAVDNSFEQGFIGLYVGSIQEVAFDNVDIVEKMLTTPQMLTKPGNGNSADAIRPTNGGVE